MIANKRVHLVITWIATHAYITVGFCHLDFRTNGDHTVLSRAKIPFPTRKVQSKKTAECIMDKGQPYRCMVLSIHGCVQLFGFDVA
jgi:hypothetical protein